MNEQHSGVRPDIAPHMLGVTHLGLRFDPVQANIDYAHALFTFRFAPALKRILGFWGVR